MGSRTNKKGGKQKAGTGPAFRAAHSMAMRLPSLAVMHVECANSTAEVLSCIKSFADLPRPEPGSGVRAIVKTIKTPYLSGDVTIFHDEDGLGIQYRFYSKADTPDSAPTFSHDFKDVDYAEVCKIADKIMHRIGSAVVFASYMADQATGGDASFSVTTLGADGALRPVMDALVVESPK